VRAPSADERGGDAMHEEQADLYCRVYVDGAVLADELAGVLASALDGEAKGREITVGGTLLEVAPSRGYDVARRHEPLNGFLYFPYCVDVTALAGQDRVAHIAITRRALEALWAGGLTAVASCDYEQALPHEGYNSRYAP
jgi:hypothetical protein